MERSCKVTGIQQWPTNERYSDIVQQQPSITISSFFNYAQILRVLVFIVLNTSAGLDILCGELILEFLGVRQHFQWDKYTYAAAQVGRVRDHARRLQAGCECMGVFEERDTRSLWICAHTNLTKYLVTIVDLQDRKSYLFSFLLLKRSNYMLLMLSRHF